MWLQLGFGLGWEGQLEGDTSSEPASERDLDSKPLKGTLGFLP